MQRVWQTDEHVIHMVQGCDVRHTGVPDASNS
jgi:hypothetical protein